MQSAQQLAQWFNQGNTAIPNLLLQYYKRIALTDQEMMLIIHLHAFALEGNDFPSLEAIHERMSLSEGEISTSLNRLLKDGYVDITSSLDNEQKRKESFTLQPLWEKLCTYLINQQAHKEIAASTEGAWPDDFAQHDDEEEGQLFKRFEQEFARPLSPMEIETISIWLDQDKYDVSLILLALREAVISSKLSLRYIDRILFEWQKNGIKTVDAAREYSKKFRQQKQTGNLQQQSQDKVEFTFYNWLDKTK